jgi:small-conductance mechanosensitive channel
VLSSGAHLKPGAIESVSRYISGPSQFPVMWQDFSQNLQSQLGDLRNALSFAPAWAVSFVLLLIAVFVAWLLHAALLVMLRRLLHGRRPYLRIILEATKNPTRVALVVLAFAVALPTAPLEAGTEHMLARVIAVATICVFGWIALTVLHIAADLYLLKFRLDVEDNLLARKHVTQIRILVRVLDTVILLLTLGFALMTFETVRQYGVSLFASAGVAGVVFGLAAQPLLSNLIAGIQLAITQPIRLEDAVTVQNEYGWIEEINATYVVIRLWDLRRMIVPLNFFIQQPFYNWTRKTAANIGTVLLYLDYSAPVDLIRAKATELIEQSPIGGRLVNVQVTNTRPDSIEVRALVTANVAGNTNDLCAELREKLIDFIRREHPDVLPRQRSQAIGQITNNPSAQQRPG